MPSLIFPRKLKISGPLFLKPENLDKLDSLISECVHRMRQRRDELVQQPALLEEMRKTVFSYEESDEALQQRVMQKYPYYLDSRTTTVYLAGDKSATGDSFAELANLPNVQDEIPLGFIIQAGVGDTSIEVRTPRSELGDLTIEVQCKDEAFAQELVGKFQNWSSDIRPSPLLTVWANWSSMFSIFLLLCGGFIVGIVLSSSTEITVNPLRSQAAALLKQGINSSNQSKAIQIILALDSGLAHTVTRTVYSPPDARFWTISIITMLILLILRKAPQGAVGIWCGKQALRRQKWWIQFVTVTIPGVILTWIIFPHLIKLLGW